MISRLLYVPDLCKNLLSVNQMVKHRMTILFEDAMVEIHSWDTGDLLARGIEEAVLYRLCTSSA